MEIQEKILSVNASLDEIADFWVKIIFAHIKSKNELEKLNNKAVKSDIVNKKEKNEI